MKKSFLVGGEDFFVTDVISEVVLGSFWLCCLAWGPTARSKCFAEIFTRN